MTKTTSPAPDVSERIRIWNECKAKGMSDDAAYRVIRERLGG